MIDVIYREGEFYLKENCPVCSKEVRFPESRDESISDRFTPEIMRFRTVRIFLPAACENCQKSFKPEARADDSYMIVPY